MPIDAIGEGTGGQVTTHGEGESQVLQEMSSGDAASGKLLQSDGAGGWILVDAGAVLPSDHGGLTGLTPDDDHPQYQLSDESSFIEDEYTPTLGQVSFTLSQTPEDATKVAVVVNGVTYDDTTDYTVSGTTLTWLNTPFSLETTDKMLVRYNKQRP